MKRTYCVGDIRRVTEGHRNLSERLIGLYIFRGPETLERFLIAAPVTGDRLWRRFAESGKGFFVFADDIIAERYQWALLGRTFGTALSWPLLLTGYLFAFFFRKPEQVRDEDAVEMRCPGTARYIGIDSVTGKRYHVGYYSRQGFEVTPSDVPWHDPDADHFYEHYFRDV